MNSLLSGVSSLTSKPILIGSWAVISFILWYIISSTAAWIHLRKFPGPVFASFSYLWGYFVMRSGRGYLIFAKEQEKYGKIMRIGPNELMVYDSEAIWQINSVRSAYPRGAWYASIRFDPYGHDVLSEPDTGIHDKKKARIIAAYSGKGNMNLEKDVDSQVAIMTDIIRNRYLGCRDSSILNFSRLIKFFQVDLITLIGVGEPWGNLTTDTDRFDFINFVSNFAPFLHSFPMVPFLRYIFDTKAYLAMAGPKTSDTKGAGGFLG